MEANTPCHFVKCSKAPEDLRRKKGGANGTRVTPINDDGSFQPKKKAKKGLGQVDKLIMHCLACGRESCPYENGYSVDHHQETEHDPHEVRFDASGTRTNGWMNQKDFSFDNLRPLLKKTVLGILQSSGFWARHKFIGHPRLDLKIVTWLKNRIPSQLVDKHCHLLRRGVKEALKFRRQHSVRLIKEAYFGENQHLFLSCVCVSPG